MGTRGVLKRKADGVGCSNVRQRQRLKDAVRRARRRLVQAIEWYWSQLPVVQGELGVSGGDPTIGSAVDGRLGFPKPGKPSAPLRSQRDPLGCLPLP
jgi:hypothetical protein